MLTVFESPSWTVGRFVPSTFTTAKSVEGSRPTSCAATVRPFVNCTWIVDAPDTTWLLVAM